MIHCFDTSAINQLEADPERDAIVKGLLATNTIYVTALNVVEACGIEDKVRRISLVKLLKQLSGGFLPLAVPNDLLQLLAVAYSKNEPAATINITITKEQAGIWTALNEPEQLGEEERQEVFQWKKDLESSFKETHRNARPHFQKLFDNRSTERPRSAATLIRHYCKDENFLYEVIGPMYQRASGVQLPRLAIRQFLTDIPQWPLYLAGWTYAIFQRAVRKEKYGPRRKAGTIDLWCAIYFPHCDCFVTHDAAQRRALRVLNVLNSRATEILSYEQFRRRLVLS